VDEASPLFLITLAFMGGAVAYSRGQFIAITILADRAPRAWNEIFKACSEWVVIIVSLLIGGYSIPLMISNAEEATIILGINYVKAIGSGDLIGVVMNAQRGAGGFIFLALPFFILAGFIMDRADVGARIVEFVASLIGHVRGGLLQVMIVGVYISSCISG